MHKRESNKRFLKLEQRNFVKEKSPTQWWYYDFFFEDGSVMVMLFTPHHWWMDKDPQSLLYVSYQKANGEVVRDHHIFSPDSVKYSQDSIKSKWLTIIKNHTKKTREYTIDIALEKIKGRAKINTERKAFSPLPVGSIGHFGAKKLLKQEGEHIRYRYAAHVPKGKVACSMNINEEALDLTGQAYHEQGMFSGKAPEMGDGWAWFHFVSESINLFGARSFFYLEKDGEILVGGLNSFKRRCVLQDTTYSEKYPNFISGGNLHFSTTKLAFDVTPDEKSVPMICIPGFDNSQQLWGDVLQPSTISLQVKGDTLIEKGLFLIETSQMSK